MIATPSSPDNVKKVSEIEGIPVNQVIVGSSANSSFRDLMITAKAMEGKHCHPDVSFEINPGSNQALLNVTTFGRSHEPDNRRSANTSVRLPWLYRHGPGSRNRSVSLRTFPRNFLGRSGSFPDSVYLCSPETAVASAIFGKITDPRRLGEYPDVSNPKSYVINDENLIYPPGPGEPVEVDAWGPILSHFRNLDHWKRILKES